MVRVFFPTSSHRIRCALADPSVASQLPAQSSMLMSFSLRTSQARLHSVTGLVLGFSPLCESLITLAFIYAHKNRRIMSSENRCLLYDKDKWRPFFRAGKAARIMRPIYFYIVSVVQVIKAKTLVYAGLTAHWL